MQETIRSSGALSLASHFLTVRNVESVVIVSGRHLDKNKITNAFQKHNSYITSPVEGLNTDINIQKIFSGCPVKADAIIAIGGGFTIDAAKLVLLQYIEKGNDPFFIGIPTTAGSGSEATPFAVVYQGNTKHSVVDEKLCPHVAILDKHQLDTLPSHQRAISCFDAVSQAIESAWSNGATKTSHVYSAFALKEIFHKINQFVEGSNEHNHKLLWRAHLSGKAIAITRTTGPHALSYYLTSHFGVPHGQAVAFFLPLFFLYNAKTEVKEAQQRLQKIYSWLHVSNEMEAFDFMNKFLKQIGLALRFSDLNLKVDLEALLDQVNEERFSNNPVPFDRPQLKNMIIEYLM